MRTTIYVRNLGRMYVVDTIQHNTDKIGKAPLYGIANRQWSNTIVLTFLFSVKTAVSLLANAVMMCWLAVPSDQSTFCTVDCPQHYKTTQNRVHALWLDLFARYKCIYTGWLTFGWHFGRRCGVVVSGVRLMDEVNPRRARWVHGYLLTVFGCVYHVSM